MFLQNVVNPKRGKQRMQKKENPKSDLNIANNNRRITTVCSAQPVQSHATTKSRFAIHIRHELVRKSFHEIICEPEFKSSRSAEKKKKTKENQINNHC